MGKIYMSYRLMRPEVGEKARFDCPHCGKLVFVEARGDEESDDITIAFTSEQELLEKEFGQPAKGKRLRARRKGKEAE